MTADEQLQFLMPQFCYIIHTLINSLFLYFLIISSVVVVWCVALRVDLIAVRLDFSCIV